MVTDLSLAAYECCELCPHRCRVDRRDAALGRGRCAMSDRPRVARAALHPWEEPVISGTRGSGTIFFVGCSLACIYCQNRDISKPLNGVDEDQLLGRDVSIERMAQMCLELEGQGAHNINLVTATHFTPHVVAAVARARANGLTIPIVYNTSGYERPEIVAALASTVDVWLTDFKYADDGLGMRYSRVGDYAQAAVRALRQMLRNLDEAGGRLVGADGTLQRGIVVRHLLLPGAIGNAKAVLDTIYEECGTQSVDVSIMNQYTPTASALSYGPPLDRPVTDTEYERVLTYADDLDFEHVWWQQGGTVAESFIPSWDNTGV